LYSRRVCVVSSEITVISFIARDKVSKSSHVTFPTAFAQKGVEQQGLARKARSCCHSRVPRRKSESISNRFQPSKFNRLR
jgi:hypothetical protein